MGRSHKQSLGFKCEDKVICDSNNKHLAVEASYASFFTFNNTHKCGNR